MAEANGIAAPFPAPPPFYKHFTKDNIVALRRLRKEAGIPQRTGNGDREIDVASLPKELQHLVPPPPPANGKYSSFGVEIDRAAPEATLASAGIEQVYPSHPSIRLNPQPHMIVLARSLLTTFLALTGILSAKPELYEEKTQDLQTLMYNMHELINQYRPHQARETLILLMEERLDKMRREIQSIDEAKEKVTKLLQGLQDDGSQQAPTAQRDHGNTSDTRASTQGESQKARLLASFQALKDELG